MKQTKFFTNRWLRLTPVLWLCGLLGFASARPALAQCPPPFQGPTYENDSDVFYTCPPNIHATDFINNSVFMLSLPTFTLYETWDTLNYTNNGSMAADSGFQFDTQSSSTGWHSMAGNFFNPGTISCASLTGGTGLLGKAGQFIVNSTNILMPGTVVVGMGGGTGIAGGLISFVGQNVDLSDSTLTLEGNGQIGGGAGSVQAIPNTATVNYAGFGGDTNKEWNPFVDLTTLSALPSLVRMPALAIPVWQYPFGNGFPFPINFASPVPTTPYQVTSIPDDGSGNPSTNDIIYRYVFVANSDPNVIANVYIDQNVADIPGTGAATVEFVGSYVDPVTGSPANNYMYVRDDYLKGVGNVGFVAGIPANFTFTASGVSLATAAPLPPNFAFQAFPNLAITNPYSFVDVECVPTTVLTNSITFNTNNYLAVLPAKIVINASSSLDLSQARISGENYISVTSSNQLNGSVGAAISSAYSDINVGVTNGNLMATNLLEPSVPAWNGKIQAWSTRWINLITNSIVVFSNSVPVSTNSFTVTNDFRVVIVANQAAPTTPSEVWNLGLRGTNSIVISDVYNILNSLYLNCVSLTLTTNGPDAASPYGELNLQSASFGNPLVNNVWSNSAPNLRYLTNDGAIFLSNIGDFGGPPPVNYFAMVNNGVIVDLGSQIWANDFESSGILYNSVGSFTLHSFTTTLTGGNAGGYLYAGGDVSITTGSLLTSNLFLEADRSLTLTATNLLTDTGTNNGNIWLVGSTSVGNGIKVPILPPGGGGGYGNSLLGTTIELFAPSNKTVVNVWPGRDYGVSTAGFSNNLAVGRLILDSFGRTNTTRFTFNGSGVSNAIYVDYLELLDGATNRDSAGNAGALNINTNLVIYYAQAVANGFSIARKLNHKNNDHLRWVPTYAGLFSSTNLVYPDGSTNTFNTALAQDTQIDSDGDGIANAFDPTPFFLQSMVNYTWYPTNNPPNNTAINWYTVPLATNYVYYSTNLVITSAMIDLNTYPTNNPINNIVISWETLSLATNYVYYSTNSGGPFDQLLTNFISSQFSSPLTNRVMVFDPMVDPGRYYQVAVSPLTIWHLLMPSFITPEAYPGPVVNIVVFDPILAPTRHYQVIVDPWWTYPF